MFSERGKLIQEVLEKFEGTAIPLVITFEKSPVKGKNITKFENYQVETVFTVAFTIVECDKFNSLDCDIGDVESITINFKRV